MKNDAKRHHKMVSQAPPTGSVSAAPPFDPYHIQQRTLDLKCDSVYLRIRLYAPPLPTRSTFLTFHPLPFILCMLFFPSQAPPLTTRTDIVPHFTSSNPALLPLSLPAHTHINASEIQGGERGTSHSRQAFQTVVTHALARAHGVVGGAVTLEHVGFGRFGFIGDDCEDERGGAIGGGGDGDVGVGIVKCHKEDADKLRTAVTLLTETHDGRGCGAAVLASSHSLVSLANRSRRTVARVCSESASRLPP